MYKLEKVNKKGVQSFWLIRNIWRDSYGMKHTTSVAVCYSLAIARICYKAIKEDTNKHGIDLSNLTFSKTGQVIFKKES